MNYFTGDFADFVLDSDVIMFWVTDKHCIAVREYPIKNEY
jgi:hypothetical protein